MMVRYLYKLMYFIKVKIIQTIINKKTDRKHIFTSPFYYFLISIKTATFGSNETSLPFSSFNDKRVFILSGKLLRSLNIYC